MTRRLGNRIGFVPKGEQMAEQYFRLLKEHIEQRKGQFMRAEDGSLHVILEGRRIPLHERDSEELANLMLQVCEVSTLGASARPAIQRLQVLAGKQAGKMKFRKFSAFAEDRLYIPLAEGVLRITSDELRVSPNGENEDKFWVEHPYDAALVYQLGVNSRLVLREFERLLVETQSCAVPEMKWLVAMHEGLFPYIRDSVPNRLILVHCGGSQQGKTSGAQRFTLLHGLGQVAGDVTPAWLGNTGDIGLLVLDNKEQANFTQELIDFCLTLATGAERGRSRSDGSLRSYKYRPVGVITSIEGVFKQELQRRCLEVQFALRNQATGRSQIEREIEENRDQIGSALIEVLQRYLRIRGQQLSPNPIPEFEEHFTALCDLLRAYGDVAGKPEEWSAEIIAGWDDVISQSYGQQEEDELEQPLLRVFGEIWAEQYSTIEFEGKRGQLYVTTCAELLGKLQALRLYDRQFPRDAKGLCKRLRSANFEAFRFLDEESAPEIEALRRTGSRRPIGFFFPDEDDAVTLDDDDEVPERHWLTDVKAALREG